LSRYRRPINMENLDALFHKYYHKTATSEEKQQLFSLLKMMSDGQLGELIQNQGLSLSEVEDIIPAEKEKVIIDKILKREIYDGIRIAHRVHFLKTAWFRYAALIIIILGIGSYIWLLSNDEQVNLKAKQVGAPIDILPGSSKAILTLSNGKKVALNKSTHEIISDQTLSIENNNGQLIYRKGALVAFNTMTTPKGAQYQLTLSDGTKVWLNAASSITFPTSFETNSRDVNITGEVYFEVVRDAKKPFRVKTKNDVIEVLGTSFNVNTYTDEKFIKTTLATGKISVNKIILQPGHAYANGKVSETNIQNDLAWIKGSFSFQDANITAVMRQISRWYDVEVKYQGKIPEDGFTGTISKKLTLVQVMRVLSKARINYTIENKTITILPEN
jgi:transmembrane sensor